MPDNHGGPCGVNVLGCEQLDAGRDPAQTALLTFRDPEGRLWLAAAALTPMRSVDGTEERPYREGDPMKLVQFKLVDAPQASRSAPEAG